jgi:hypothetical protein
LYPVAVCDAAGQQTGVKYTEIYFRCHANKDRECIIKEDDFWTKDKNGKKTKVPVDKHPSDVSTPCYAGDD